MKYHLLCTSYNILSDETLQLRNNWIEPCVDDQDLSDKLTSWEIDLNSFQYPPKISISNILWGKMSIGNPIHVRIIRF